MSLPPPASPVAERGGPPAQPPRRARAWLAAAVALLTSALALAAAGTGYTYEPWGPGPEPGEAEAASGAGAGSPAPSAEERNLERALRRAGQKRLYVAVDSANNRLYLVRDGKIILDTVCSTGSGLVLKQVDADREWVFDTPRGIHTIFRKAHNPVWVKPDWAFLEDGQPVPDRFDERVEHGSLGEYGLYFGDGFLIHGTLYENLLGRHVTHGCIRLGKENLRKVNDLCPLGTPVLVF